MNFLRSIAMAFSMFSRLRVPRVEWRAENMRWALAALPAVGAVIGLALWGWSALCEWLGFGKILFAAGVTLVPLAITGGIHLDGFADTVDALSSHGDAEKRRAILKDPHAGAFAVIWTGAYLLAYFALASELRAGAALFLALMHTASRAATGFGALVFPARGGAGLLSALGGSAARGSAAAAAAVYAACCVAAVVLLGAPGAALTGAAGCAVFMYFLAKGKFGGMSGDLSGFLLQVSELAMLAGYVVLRGICD